jgi:hypothetical protein
MLLQHPVACLSCRHLLVAAVLLACLGLPDSRSGAEAPLRADPRLAPYAADPKDLWNELHRALFLRVAPDGILHIHSTDPLLYRGGTFLLEGESHRNALALLEKLLAAPADRLSEDPLRRLVLQRDLWAAFDYLAWYPDEWVYYSRQEPAAVAVRTRLARAISRLALDDRAIATLPDNYASAVKSKRYPADHDPDHRERPFLPPDLFDPAGPWVRFHETTAAPMARHHFDAAGGRAVHVIFLRLPGGRAATERYLKELRGDAVEQFPVGTMVAMVRRALAVDRSAKIRLTPLTELVQIRVYRRIPEGRPEHRAADPTEQDVCEFVLDRERLFAGQPGLRAVGPDDPEERFERHGGDPFDDRRNRPGDRTPYRQLQGCIHCHAAPGVRSMLSMERGLREGHGDTFRTYDWDVEPNFTVRRKIDRFDWGLLQGLLEAR